MLQVYTICVYLSYHLYIPASQIVFLLYLMINIQVSYHNESSPTEHNHRD